MVSFSYLVNDQMVAFEAISPGSFNWLWDFGDGFLSVLENPVHFYQDKGTYEVCLWVEDSCGMAEYCEMVNVCDMPVAGFGYQAEGLSVFFQDTSVYPLYCFWSFGDGYFSDLKEPWHQYDAAGSYEVCLRIQNECGEDTICQWVIVDYSGLEELSGALFSVYPNPADDWLVIRDGNATAVGRQSADKVIITDLTGQVVGIYENPVAFPLQIGVGSLTAGFYMIRIFDAGEMISAMKFLKF